MPKKIFIPNWYLDKKNEKKNKKIKICIIMVLSVNIFLFSFILRFSNKIKNTEHVVSNKTHDVIIEQGVDQNTFLIDKYKDLSDFFEENKFSYKNIVITKGNLEIDFEVNNYKQYIDVIKCIEDNFSIKKLTPLLKKGKNFNFIVILEV